MITLDAYGARLHDPERIARMAEMLVMENEEFIRLFGPFPAAPPKPWYLRAWRKLGYRLVTIGCTMMGEEAPELS